VTDYAQAETMARRAEETFGGVDVLVNAAGIMLPAPIAGADPADWRRMVDVNLLGVLYATRAVLPGMLERGDGHIVNVSSPRAESPPRSSRCAKTLRDIILDDCYKPHTFEEVRELVGKNVAATLNPEANYGISWYGRHRTSVKQVVEVGSGGKRYRRLRGATEKPREQWIAVPVIDSGLPRELVEAARESIADNRKASSAGSRFWELSGGIMWCGNCGFEADRKRSGFQDLAAEGLITIEELRGKLAELEETRHTAEKELEELKQHQRHFEELERDKDAVLEAYAQMAPQALDGLTAEERHQLYKMLRVRVIACADGPLEITGMLGKDAGVRKTEPTPGCST